MSSEALWISIGSIFAGITLAWMIFTFIFKENQVYIKESLKEIKSTVNFIMADIGHIKTKQAVHEEKVDSLEKQIIKRQKRS